MSVAQWAAILANLTMLAFVVGAAAAQYRAFVEADKAARPGQGDDGALYAQSLIEQDRIRDNAARAKARERAEVYHTTAPWLVAGAALEVFALSLHGTIALGLMAMGLLPAIVPVARWRKARTTLTYLDAATVRELWRNENKDIESAADRASQFAKAYPKEAALIAEREYGFPEE